MKNTLKLLVKELTIQKRKLEGKSESMSAKEMFENLCFYEKTNNSAYLIYEMYGQDKYTDDEVTTIITFKKHEKLVRVKKLNKTSSYNFNAEEIQAINKQIEELGW